MPESARQSAGRSPSDNRSSEPGTPTESDAGTSSKRSTKNRLSKLASKFVPGSRDSFAALQKEYAKKPPHVKYDLDLSHAALKQLFPAVNGLDEQEAHFYFLKKLKQLVNADAKAFAMTVLDRRHDFDEQVAALASY
eukprot:GFYU01004437.1.p1 GENE.GFYU01004437.1~~GFYU01004437.1.p1  ORF type:complete len:137 (-),score=15.85 GFYU01004437.1:108-518(-)